MLGKWAAVLCLTACAFVAQTLAASAGAWPREKGTGFTATSVRLSWPKDVLLTHKKLEPIQYNTFYFEYGLNHRLTVGLDLGRSVSGKDKTILFFKLPVRNAEDGPKISAHLGFGQVAGDTVIRPGLSLGWGLKNGWISIDAFSEFGVTHGKSDSKVDITWGRKYPNDHKLILQLQTGDPATDPPFARLAPSYVFPLSDRLKLETGASWGLFGDDSLGLKVGVWASF